jgi:hypothetical protein
MEIEQRRERAVPGIVERRAEHEGRERVRRARLALHHRVHRQRVAVDVVGDLRRVEHVQRRVPMASAPRSIHVAARIRDAEPRLRQKAIARREQRALRPSELPHPSPHFGERERAEPVRGALLHLGDELTRARDRGTTVVEREPCARHLRPAREEPLDRLHRRLRHAHERERQHEELLLNERPLAAEERVHARADLARLGVPSARDGDIHLVRAADVEREDRRHGYGT